MNVLHFCKTHGLDNIVIFHDYEGYVIWVENRWKASSHVAQKYVRYAISYDLSISFRRIKGHIGNSYHKKVDKLARTALRMICPSSVFPFL